MDREEIIERFHELMNIPQFVELMELELKKLEITLQKPLSEYRRLREGFEKTVYGNMMIHKGKHQPQVPVYRFEISRIKDNYWAVTAVDPDPPPDEDLDNIIPPDFVSLVACFNPFKDEIRSHRGEFNTPGGRKEFDIRFSKYSSDNAMGTIRQVNPSEKTEPVVCRNMKILNPDASFEIYNDEKNFSDLFFYMKRYPEIKRQILEEFFTLLKPMADLEVSLSSLS